MADAVATNIIFLACERNDTRNGKERYIARAADGREFSVWDANLANAVKGHLHEELACEVSSRQDDRGKWWNTLHALPALGIQAVDTRQQGNGGGGASAPSSAASVNLDAVVPVLERIALALENLVSFQAARALASGPAPDEPDADDEPDPEP